MVHEYAAFAWAVVQIDLNGGVTPSCGVGGLTSNSLEVQKTKRAMALCRLCWPSEIFSDV